MAISQVGYLGLEVSNIDEWESYTTKVLGMELTEKAEDGTVYFRMDEYHHRLALHPGSTDDLSYIGFLAANRHEFESIKAKLFEAGVEYVVASKDEIANRHVVDMVRYDMGGIPAEVYWGGHIMFERPFYPSVPMTGFKTGLQGLGHVGLFPDDVEQFERILRDCLGFKESDVFDFLGVNVTFFHCNGREHSVVAFPKNFVSYQEKKLNHLMIEVNSIDDVGLCLNRVQDRNIRVITGLGKHTNDHMVSFYCESPSGFGVEYGWNGRVIDDETWIVNSYRGASAWRAKAP